MTPTPPPSVASSPPCGWTSIENSGSPDCSCPAFGRLYFFLTIAPSAIILASIRKFWAASGVDGDGTTSAASPCFLFLLCFSSCHTGSSINGDAGGAT
ncbi:hypothetical protein Zm00014a_016853 [Zea mays]|uniref:Uncharacterized protein n=1 Tax=Zea mays TaxID=4577 RepID=A0A317YAV3_MAIZE|nr:hypothetical protein Zm00014a_016853 [Zea mays]